MGADNTIQIEWQCQKAVMEFFRCLDTNDYPGLLARMHPEGIWSRQGKDLQGEKQVMEAMKERSPTLRIHHLLMNVRVDCAPDQRSASLFGYLVVFRHDDGAPIKGAAPLKGVSTISTCTAELRPSGDAWTIYRMANDRTFAS